MKMCIRDRGGIAAADLAESGVIGFIGGMDESLVIQEFLWGYIQGAKAYNPDTKIVYNYVGAWNDPDTAKTQAMTQYNDAGADVILSLIHILNYHQHGNDKQVWERLNQL